MNNNTHPQIAIYTHVNMESMFTKQLRGNIYYFDKTLDELVYHKGYPDYTEEIGMYLSQLHLAKGREEEVILLSLPIHHKHFLFYIEKKRLFKVREADFLLLLLKAVKETNYLGIGKDTSFKALCSNYFSPAAVQFGQKLECKTTPTIPDRVSLKIQTEKTSETFKLVLSVNHEGHVFIARNQRILSFTSALKDLVALISSLLKGELTLSDQLMGIFRETGFFHDQRLTLTFDDHLYCSAIKNLFEINETGLDWKKHEISHIANYYIGTSVQQPDFERTDREDISGLPHLQINFKNGTKLEVDSSFDFNLLSFYLSGPLPKKYPTISSPSSISKISMDRIIKIKNDLLVTHDEPGNKL